MTQKSPRRTLALCKAIGIGLAAAAALALIILLFALLFTGFQLSAALNAARSAAFVFTALLMFVLAGLLISREPDIKPLTGSSYWKDHIGDLDIRIVWSCVCLAFAAVAVVLDYLVRI